VTLPIGAGVAYGEPVGKEIPSGHPKSRKMRKVVMTSSCTSKTIFGRREKRKQTQRPGRVDEELQKRIKNQKAIPSTSFGRNDERKCHRKSSPRRKGAKGKTSKGSQGSRPRDRLTRSYSRVGGKADISTGEGEYKGEGERFR